MFHGLLGSVSLDDDMSVGSDPDVGFLAKNWAGLHTLVRSGGGGGDDI